jgi:putative IMPACT (imprinted ancient) family translation regulator
MSVFVKEIPCQQLVELVTDYFEGNLSWRDRRRFRAHIDDCDHCTAYLEQMRVVIEATGRLTEVMEEANRVRKDLGYPPLVAPIGAPERKYRRA